MGLGILSDPYLGEDVPGTSLLDDLHSHGALYVDAPTANLKRGKDGIILVPQPSDSPNDPLNWPFWRKTMLMLTITFGAGVVGAFGPIIGAGLVQVAENLNSTVGELSKITGDLVLSIGLILILTAPASVVWGRRPIFLIGNAFLLASAIWSAVAKDLGSLTASRVIGGIGMAPIECLVEATVADIFFVHERGRWIAVWSFALLGGICGVSIVNGYLIQDVSWRICFVIEAALTGVLLIMTILFVPETAYIRQEFNTVSEVKAEPGPELVSASKGLSPSKTSSDEKGFAEIEMTADIESSKKEERPQTFLQLMKPWAGHRFSDQSLSKIAIRPFALVLSPVVAWGALVYGTTNAWVVALSVCVSLLFSDPQFGYNFKAGPVGLIAGVGPFIAAFLGNVIAGPLSDWVVKWMSRRNGGIYEPEFRLMMVFPLFITTTMGWFGWAVSANLEQLWIGPEIFFSLINFGQAVASIAVVSYVVDAHSNYAPEAFATINAIKNLFAFGVTYFVTDWILSQGVLKTFCTIGGINAWVCLMTIPMYIYGKRARSWVHRTPWMLA
ncbi:MFS general substrate transporter, partial [Phellopilus nigrolimitatus]